MSRPAAVVRGFIVPALVLVSLVAPQIGRGDVGDPPPWCLFYHFDKDFAFEGYEKGYVVEKVVGSDDGCKPTLEAYVWIRQTGPMAESGAECSLDGLRVTWRHKLCEINPSVTASVDSVPWVATVRSQVTGQGGGSPNWYVDVNHQTTGGSGNNFYVSAELRGTAVLGPSVKGLWGRCADVATTNELWIGTSITRQDSAHKYQHATEHGAVDPWIEVDPDWPNADGFVVLTETAPNSEVWVPMSRDWMTIWTDVSSTSMVTGPGAGVTWVDFDGDGDLDLHGLNYTGYPDRLYRNDGSGVFVDVAAGAIADMGSGRGCAWGDYDNDGDLDVYLVKMEPEPNTLLRNEGSGVFTDVTSGPLGNTGLGQAAAWADYDLDGDLDLYLVNCAVSNKLFRNDGGGAFTDVTAAPIDDPALCAYSTSWADYDGDGDPDILLANMNWETGQLNRLFRNNGNGTFTDVATGGLAGPRSSTGGAWVDYDNDLDLDLYVTNWGAGNQLFRNDAGVMVERPGVATEIGGYTYASPWEDYDLDGDADAYVCNSQGSALVYNRADADSFRTGLLGTWGPVLDPGGAASAGDFDADGDLDLATSDNGRIYIYRNDSSNGNHWFKANLVGTTSNRFGVGAKVIVAAGATIQMQEVRTGLGRSSSSSVTADFGLGDAASLDYVEVRWPSGLDQVIPGPIAADQLLTVVEGQNPMAGVESGTDSPAAARLLPLRPNPSDLSTAIRFDLPARSAVSLCVYDVAGRRVRCLSDDAVWPAGSHELVWDGRDDSGKVVAPEIYFVRMKTAASSDIRKLVLVR